MSKLKASFFLKTAVFLLAAFVLAVSPASVGAEETCKPELSFADPPIARDYRIWSQYRYHGSNSGVIWCGENAIIYGIRSFRDKHGMFPDREPAADPVILWRDLASGEVQTVVSGRRVLDEMDEYDSAGTPLACTARNMVFYSSWVSGSWKIYYWTPGTDWNPETEGARALPFPGADVLPSPDGSKVVMVAPAGRRPVYEKMETVRIGPSGEVSVIQLPTRYTPHAWLQDSRRLLVSENAGESQPAVRGIFDLGKPDRPFHAFDWPDQFQELIEYDFSAWDGKERIDDAGDTYTLRYIRKGSQNTAQESSVVVLDRCYFTPDRVVCEQVGQPTEILIGYFHFPHPTEPVLYYNSMPRVEDRDLNLYRYDAATGTAKAVTEGGVYYPSDRGRFVRRLGRKSFVHSVNDCR